ncbi:MAG: HAD hydrolase-like protein [Spirochaetes bacterium]|nr:HAD hydrolase-like protein [Spirochaetota bacterium]MBU1081000.1 HAD hydrolase-like protein [Spirochaetota bacterium]
MNNDNRDPAQILKDLKPTEAFFIGVDSDGCVFDSMEIKQKECFCPNFIKHYGLQAVSKYAREAWEFVNLYSKTRGCNRYPAVTRALDLLRERPETAARGVSVPEMAGLKDWIRRETKLGLPALKAESERTGDADLSAAYLWSVEVDETVEKIVRDVPPFPLARESLEAMRGEADVMVVSQTPFETLRREWEEHGVDGYVRLIAGQEMGTKAEHLAYAAKGKYQAGRILMVGDAPGDLEAAKKNGVLFYPVNPGHEEASWKRFREEALGKFFAGSYAGSYENALIQEFDGYLPELPPWRA